MSPASNKFLIQFSLSDCEVEVKPLLVRHDGITPFKNVMTAGSSATQSEQRNKGVKLKND